MCKTLPATRPSQYRNAPGWGTPQAITMRGPSGETFTRGASSTPYGNLQEDGMSDQIDLIRGTLDC
jgi:hypothetical protein